MSVQLQLGGEYQFIESTCLFVGLMHIIGLATPYWHSIDITNRNLKSDPYGHHGLWVACTIGAFDTVDCDSHADTRGNNAGNQCVLLI